MQKSACAMRGAVGEWTVIAHVIRVFDDPSVPHSEGASIPCAMRRIWSELMLSDHDQITRRGALEKD